METLQVLRPTCLLLPTGNTASRDANGTQLLGGGALVGHLISMFGGDMQAAIYQEDSRLLSSAEGVHTDAPMLGFGGGAPVGEDGYSILPPCNPASVTCSMQGLEQIWKERTHVSLIQGERITTRLLKLRYSSCAGFVIVLKTWRIL